MEIYLFLSYDYTQQSHIQLSLSMGKSYKSGITHIQ